MYKANILNKPELNKPFIFNTDILKEIVTENFNELKENYSKNFNENESENIDKLLIKLIDENSSDENTYNILNLLDLFSEIESELLKYFMCRCINYDSLIEIYDYIIYELERYLNINLNEIIFKLDISNINLLNNNTLYLSDELLEDEIDALYLEDLRMCFISDVYENEILFSDIYIMNNINKYEIFESILIDAYSDEISSMSSLKYEYNKKINENEIRYYLELSLEDLISLNRLISENISFYNESNLNSYLEDQLIFNLEDVSDLFENLNNSFPEDTFIYLVLENFYEYLFNDFYDEIYYEYSDNISKFKKVSDIYELIKIVLNRFQHLNLSNSYTFSEDAYNLI